jgi:MFS transporter, OFA family, oxalate/formate antiporter
VPVATLVEWFPEKRGMLTGIAVAGFGAGALIRAPIASRLIISISVLKTFAVLGIAYFVAVTAPANFMKDPPAGFRPEGGQPSEAQKRQRAGTDYTLAQISII